MSLRAPFEKLWLSGWPMRHSALYFSIKSNVHLVHNRIRKCRAELSAPLRSVRKTCDAPPKARAGFAALLGSHPQ